MLQGARNRLAYLRGEIAIRIIREAVILAALICKLRLKKKIFTLNYARCDRSRHCSPDSFFDIVLTLIRRIKSAETGGNRLERQRLSPVLLPGGTIHYRWRSDAPEINSSGSSHETEYLEGTVGKQENWVEAEIRGQSVEARRAVRQGRAKPAVAALKTWLMERLAELSGKSIIAERSAMRWVFARDWSGSSTTDASNSIPIPSSAACTIESQFGCLIALTSLAARRSAYQPEALRVSHPTCGRAALDETGFGPLFRRKPGPTLPPLEPAGSWTPASAGERVAPTAIENRLVSCECCS